jgi:hypothetical protein
MQIYLENKFVQQIIAINREEFKSKHTQKKTKSLYMKKFYPQIPILLMILLVNPCFSQVKKDTILLLNGDILTGKITEMTVDHFTIKESEKMVRGYSVDNDRIFSYINADGEYFLYVYDSLNGNDFTIAEMRYYMKGERDGKKGFGARPAFYTNMLIGAASGLSGSFFFPVPPFAFAVLVGIPKVKIRKNTVSNLDDLNHPPYIMGYERMARKNRKIQSLIGGGIGLVAGLSAFMIIQSANK